MSDQIPKDSEFEDALELPTTKRSRGDQHPSRPSSDTERQEANIPPGVPALRIDTPRGERRGEPEVPRGDEQGEQKRRVRGKQQLTARASAFWARQEAGVELCIDFPDNEKAMKHALRDLTAYVNTQLRRQRAEVREKNLASDERERFRGAKL